MTFGCSPRLSTSRTFQPTSLQMLHPVSAVRARVHPPLPTHRCGEWCPTWGTYSGPREWILQPTGLSVHRLQDPGL